MKTEKEILKLIQEWPWTRRLFFCISAADRSKRMVAVLQTEDDFHRYTAGGEPHAAYAHIAYELVEDSEGRHKRDLRDQVAGMENQLA